MRILGIDPGTRLCGFGCLELRAAGPAVAVADSVPTTPMAQRVGNLLRPAGGRLRYCESGVLRLGGVKQPVPQRLAALQAGLRELIGRLRPELLALEEAYFGKSVSSALRVGEARGVILAEAAAAGLRIEQFAPARVKRSVTGGGAAGKERVADMVGKVLQLEGQPATMDETDALAVALCCAEGLRGFPRTSR